MNGLNIYCLLAQPAFRAVVTSGCRVFSLPWPGKGNLVADAQSFMYHLVESELVSTGVDVIATESPAQGQFSNRESI